jgi:hypothetical protein
MADFPSPIARADRQRMQDLDRVAHVQTLPSHPGLAVCACRASPTRLVIEVGMAFHHF